VKADKYCKKCVEEIIHNPEYEIGSYYCLYVYEGKEEDWIIKNLTEIPNECPYKLEKIIQNAK